MLNLREQESLCVYLCSFLDTRDIAMVIRFDLADIFIIKRCVFVVDFSLPRRGWPDTG